MRKTIVVLLVILLAAPVFLSSAGAQEEDVNRVAYIARAQADSFAAWLANSILIEAEKYPDITVDVMDGQADDATVNAFIENSIVNQYDLIILQANNAEAQRPYVEQVVDAGIPIILTNPRIEGIDGTHTVDADPYEQGAVNARLAVDQVPENANVVILNGPAGNMHSTARREAWQKEFLDERPDVQVVGEQIAHWNKEEAMAYMEDWVQSISRIDAVISMNDNMAAGALEVVRGDSAFEDLLVYGVDGTAEAALLIEEGLLTSTSFQSAYELARLNLDLADRILSGEVTDYVHTDIDCPLITKENVHILREAHEDAGNL